MELNQGHQELIKMVLDPEERKRFRRVLKRQYEKDDIEWIKNNQLKVLVATDIASRGIDIDKLGFVLNYDIPNIAETYVHRIGRCGRAGKEGVSISICEPEENAYIRDIEKLIKQKIEVVQDHPFKQTDKPMNAKEKKEFEKEKARKRQEFFANRKKRKRR